MANILKSSNENLYKAFKCMYGNILSTLLENSIIIWPLKHFFINIGKNIKRYSNFIKKITCRVQYRACHNFSRQQQINQYNVRILQKKLMVHHTMKFDQLYICLYMEEKIGINASNYFLKFLRVAWNVLLSYLWLKVSGVE